MMTRAQLLQFLILILFVTVRMANAEAPKSPVHDSVRAAHVGAVRLGAGNVHKSKLKNNSRSNGQQSIHSNRVREIQAALIRENYLSGPASGVWDQQSKKAMAHFQSDNGWQRKRVPDSRALIKLGLGPRYADLINPDTADISFTPQLWNRRAVSLSPGAVAP